MNTNFEKENLQQAGRQVIEYGRRLLETKENKYKTSVHINTALGVAQYKKIASEALELLPPQSEVLDWGSGWGHNSYLLSRTMSVTPFDVRDNYAPFWPLLFEDQDFQPVIGRPDQPLPFDDGNFDGVLNCGVLEHVNDERFYLHELARVLRSDGLLLTYHLPNRFSWTEWLGRRSGRIVHERLYGRRRIMRLWQDAGFEVIDIKRHNWLPRNVLSTVGVGEREGRLLSLFLAADRLLASFPLTSPFSTAWRVIARKCDNQPDAKEKTNHSG